MTQPTTGTSPFHIRQARTDDIRAIAKVWRDSFPGGRSLGDRIQMLEAGGRYGGVEGVLVAEEEGGAIVGACKIYPLTQHIAGVAMPMMGLAAVAVIPSRRRRGLAARLCTAAIESAAERGDVISTLYPFRPDYYERLGWGLVGALHEYRFRTRALQVDGDREHVRAAELDRDAGAIAACYGRVAAGSNGPIERDRMVWAYRLTGEELGVRVIDAEAVWTARTDPDLRCIVYDDGGITGYALVRYVQEDSPEEHTLQVRELGAETVDAYRGLLATLASQHDQWPLCQYFARPDEHFGDYLGDPRPPGFRGARGLYFPTARIVRGPMLRLVDVRGALERRRYFDAGGTSAGTFSVTVADEQRPANHGPWTVAVDGDGVGTASGPAGDADRRDADAAIETDPATLARIFAGEIAPSRAGRQGRAVIEGDGGFLDRAFATRERFWLMDEF